MKQETLAETIYRVIKQKGEPMSVSEIYEELHDMNVNKPRTTVRGRIYDNLNKMFKRVAKGVYWIIDENSSVLVVEGNGRDLSMIEDCSIDAIITDHPWSCESNIGRNRNFTSSYQEHTFNYTIEDFREKARVLKEGAFLVEIIPEENASNYKYLYQIKKMAAQCGLEYYAKVPWVKAKNRPNYTGRKAKDSEEILFFTKGKARKLRPDKQREKLTGEPCLMSGTSYMLPTRFEYERPSKNERIHQSEKPVELFEAILEAVTLPGEVVIDQFAGSGNLGKAALNTGRFALLFEIMKENVDKIVKNLGQRARKIYAVDLEKDETMQEIPIHREPVQLDMFSFA